MNGNHPSKRSPQRREAVQRCAHGVRRHRALYTVARARTHVACIWHAALFSHFIANSKKSQRGTANAQTASDSPRPLCQGKANMKTNRILSALCFVGIAGMLLGCSDAIDSDMDAESIDESTSALAITGKLMSGPDHSCAIMEDSTIRCWGLNSSGQIGDGTTTTRWSPVSVDGLTNVVAVSTGHGITCAIVAGGTTYCWGGSGRVGDGTNITRHTPTPVSGLVDAIAIDSGYDHSCAIRAGGSVVCWGGNSARQLGDNTNVGWSYAPVPVYGLTDAIAIDVGSSYSCAVRVGGQVVCWGSANSGRLGNGSSTGIVPTPTPVTGISNAIAISAGNFHTCALLSDATLMCWGQNSRGQLGIGTMSSMSTVPVAVQDLTDVISISAGYSHTCAVRGNGCTATDAYCWGFGYSGQLGNGIQGSGSDQALPSQVLNLTGAASISTGSSFSCASLSDGSAKCWGLSSSGHLGDGGGSSTSIPVDVIGL